MQRTGKQMVVSYSSGGFGAQVLGGEQKRAFVGLRFNKSIEAA
jgi:hypothetical protein